MPIISISTSVPVNDESFRAVRASVVGSTAEILQKSPGTILFSVQANENMSLGLDGNPAVAFVRVIKIGELTHSQKEAITRSIFESLATLWDIRGDCVYLNFVNVNRSDWSWNSKVLANG